MDSPVNTKPTDPHANPALSTQEMELVSRADERLAHAYEQIVRADQELARFNEQISRLEKKPANRPRRSSRGSPALRGFIGLLLTAGICTAAFAWQSYGETVRPMVSRWVPQLASDSSLSSATPKLADQQSQRPRTSAVTSAAPSANPPRPVATPARKPVSTVPPTQARVQARAPVQARQQ